MTLTLTSTPDPRAIAALHVKQLAEIGKPYSAEEVVERWQKVPNRNFLTAGTAGFLAFQNTGDASCYISDLYVDPTTRGRGIARALLQEVKRHHTLIDLHVEPRNEAARALYRSEGFIESQCAQEEPTRRIRLTYTAAP